MGQITVFRGPERRRRWSNEERLRILTEAFAPGACVADVARRRNISTGLIYTWRRKLRQEQPVSAPLALLGSGFAEAVVADEPRRDVSEPGPAIVVDLSGGGRVSISVSASPALAAAALRALR